MICLSSLCLTKSQVQCCPSNLSVWEVEAGGSGVQSQLQLQIEFKASLGYRRPHLKKGGGDWGGLVSKYEDQCPKLMLENSQVIREASPSNLRKQMQRPTAEP